MVDKEIVWILGNVLASNHLQMTCQVLNNQYFCEKFIEILRSVSEPTSTSSSYQYGTESDRLSACREVFHLIRNAIIGYQYEVAQLILGNLNLLKNLLPFVNPDRQHNFRLTEFAL